MSSYRRVKKRLTVASEVARKTHKVGGQKGNKNAMKHGAYQQIDRIDKRTTDGKLIASIEAALCDALGNPSPQEILAIQRGAVIAWRCNKFEKRILAGNGDAPESLERAYMQFSNLLSADRPHRQTNNRWEADRQY